MNTIVIDPGHGGTEEVDGSSANNATGPTGLLEKNVTLEVAKRIKARTTDADVILTRNSDINLGLDARAKVAKDKKAPVFISIHFNGWPTQDVQGSETYVHASGSASSLRLAKAVQSRIVAATGLKDRGLKRADFGVIKPSNHDAATAACLVEISFMTQASEEARLKTSAYLDRLADAISSAAKAYLAAPLEMVPDTEAQQIEDLPLVLGYEDAAERNLQQ